MAFSELHKTKIHVMKKLNAQFCLLIINFMLYNWGKYIDKLIKIKITHKHKIENVWHIILVYKKFWHMNSVNTLDMVLLCKVVAKNRILQFITHFQIPTKHKFWDLFPATLLPGREFKRSLNFFLLGYKFFIYMSLWSLSG